MFKTPQTYAWNSKPTGNLNQHIVDDSFLTMITANYNTALPNLNLDCNYADNPRASLVLLLAILGTEAPDAFLDTMFAKDHTVSSNIIDSICKQNEASNHFQ
jgi:hypothetical protein